MNVHVQRYFTQRKKGIIPLFSVIAIILFLISGTQVTQAQSLDNQRIVFGDGAEWMKPQVSLSGNILTIDFSHRFSSYLDPESIQLDPSSQGGVSISTDKSVLKIDINDFGESIIKVNAADKNGKKEQDQFNLKITKTGDINGDGIVNPSDALYIYQAISGKLSLSDEEMKLLDINGDGSVTSADASLLMTKYVGKQTASNVSDNFFVGLSDINDAPIANDDQYTIDEDQSLQIDKNHSILGNDADVEGNALNAVKETGTAHGKLTLKGDGTFTYVPDPNFAGEDQFTYKVNDGDQDSDKQTVTIEVKAVNDAPEAKADNFSVDEDGKLDVKADAGILLNDTDVENDALTAVKVSGPEHGTLALNADGAFTYAPDANFVGKDQFTYKVNDGKLDSKEQTVTIEVKAVNDAPEAKADNFSVNEDEKLDVKADAGILSNDTDVENDALTAVKVSGPEHGTLALNADGAFTYAPDANFAGKDQFTYKANDGKLDSKEQTVTIEVKAVNDAPEAKADNFSVDEDGTLDVKADAGILLNDTDVENDALTAKKVSDPNHGTLTLNEDGTFTYKPEADFNGKDQFTYKANDGKLDSKEQTVTIEVKAVNDAPEAKADNFSVDEDGSLDVKADAGILSNDTDADKDALTAVKVNGPSHGTLTLNGDGTFTYKPEANFNGKDQFTYKANDGKLDSKEQTVTIEVKSVNDAPEARADNFSVDEDGTLDVKADAGILSNDTDSEKDALTAVKANGPSHGTLTLNEDGTFTYKPEADFNGEDQFTYKANDGKLDSKEQTVTIEVKAVNDAPEAKADNFSVDEDGALDVKADAGILSNDTDAEKDALTAKKVSGPSHGTLTLNGDGTFTYKPEADFNGKDQFTYKANDGKLDSKGQTVTIEVKAVNDAPEAKADNFSVDENGTLDVKADAGILSNDTDADKDALTAVKVSGPSHGTLTLNEDGTFTYKPEAYFNGKDQFTYKANDGKDDSDEQTVTIEVKAVNDAPEAKADNFSVDEDETLDVKADAGILSNDTDADKDALTAVKVNGPSHGTLTLNADGTFTYKPDSNFNGEDQFTYKANDGKLDSKEQTVTIEVKAVNDAPRATNVSISGDFTIGETLKGSYTFSDPENDPEGSSIYQWYQSDDSDGTHLEAIDGANGMEYKLQDTDLDKYVFFKVTPVAAAGTQTNQSSLSSPSKKIEQGDHIPPSISSVLPENNAKDVSNSVNLEITFSEKVIAKNGLVSIHKIGDDSAVASYSANDTNHVMVEDNKVTINHPDFESGESYYLTIAPDAFTDVKGNAFEGIKDQTDWAFTTEKSASLTASADIPLTETNLKEGNYISLHLDGDTFKQGLSASDFSLNNAPPGLTIAIAYNDVDPATGEPTAGILFDFDGTDFDKNVDDFSVTAKASATEKGQEVTSNPMAITAEIEPPSAFFSQYLDGGDGRIAFEIQPSTGDLSGYELDAYEWMKTTNKMSVVNIPFNFSENRTPYRVINYTFYDFFDLINTDYYNTEAVLYKPSDFTLNALVLKKDGKVVDVIGNQNSKSPNEILPNGGTWVRKSGLIHGASQFVNSEWTLYPKGTYQYYGHY